MPLITSKELFEKAYKGKYAIGAFNVNNMEIVQAITDAAKEEASPIILQVSAGARKYARHIYLMKLVEAAVIDSELPIVLHLDHGGAGLDKDKAFEEIKSCVDGGFSSVMIDGSHYSFQENIELTKRCADYAHSKGVVVEAELGKLSGIEDAVNVAAGDAMFTDPNEVEEFVAKTGVDSLAVAIGTSHGAYKFKPGQVPQLRFDILQEISNRLPGFPIVLHGASSVVPEYVDMINAHGGNMPDAIGIPEDMLRTAASMAVCKINIDSDLRLCVTGSVRKYFDDKPEHFDPRDYLSFARSNLKELVRNKIRNVLGSSGTI